MTIEEHVAELEQKMRELRDDYAAGRITNEIRNQRLQTLCIDYLDRRWAISFSGQWYRIRLDYITNWIKSKSPLLVSPEELANDPTWFGIDDRSNIIEFNLNQPEKE